MKLKKMDLQRVGRPKGEIVVELPESIEEAREFFFHDNEAMLICLQQAIILASMKMARDSARNSPVRVEGTMARVQLSPHNPEYRGLAWHADVQPLNTSED